MQLLSATLEAKDKIILTFDQQVKELRTGDVYLSPAVEILRILSLAHVVELTVSELDLTKNYTIFVKRRGMLPVVLGSVLDEFVSAKQMGCSFENNRFTFRVFSPRASAVHLVITRDSQDDIGTQYEMVRDSAGVWELTLNSGAVERFYRYKVYGPEGDGEGFNSEILIADPYSKAVVSKNTYRQEAFSIVIRDGEPFAWEGDSFVSLSARDALIYEMHVRDMTIHPSSGIDRSIAGSYRALTEAGYKGGFDYINSLGVNAVELMPVQQFARIEPPYKRQTPEGYFNVWNPYEYNHWGYMTSFFFTPEPTYASNAERGKGLLCDTGAMHLREFKEMVKTFHSAGIAVIMDVVYNHTSQYNLQPLKYLDQKYYYHSDEHGRLLSASGCGNDFNAQRPMARKLLIDSVLYWMNEFHIDGFRFDLASLIDEETFHQLREAARAVNPHVLFIAEPWGGGRHELDRFSNLGFSAWNDIFRNSVKGENPLRARGFIFGTWGWNSPEAFGKWVTGCTTRFGGPFLDAGHSVNYLESHDGYTLGDFIRIGSGERQLHEPVLDIERHVALSPLQMRLNKLAALMLYLSQGATMIHAGQEFARSKVVAQRRLPDIEVGILDENSYENDDDTNWINYRHAEANSELLEYHRGLIAIRNLYPIIRHAPHEQYRFLIPDASLASGYILEDKGNASSIAFLINPNPDMDARYELPEKPWRILADSREADPRGRRTHTGGATVVPRQSGLVMVAEKELL